MRTTLNLNDDLARRAKEAAARERTTLTRLIEEGLRLRLRPPAPATGSPPPPLPVYDGHGGLAPGVDPLSNRSLYEAADGGDAADPAGGGPEGGRVTPDVNVLVAASRRDHPHHGPALAWLDGALADCAAGAPFSVLPVVAAGVVRLVTHPRVFEHPTPTDEAVAFVESVLGRPGVERPALGREWPAFAALCRAHGLQGNAVPDGWIAAAVRDRHEHLVTFDRGFRRLLPPSALTVLDPVDPGPVGGSTAGAR